MRVSVTILSPVQKCEWSMCACVIGTSTFFSGELSIVFTNFSKPYVTQKY